MTPTNLVDYISLFHMKNNPDVGLHYLVEEEGGDEADDRHAHVEAVEHEPHAAGLQH